VVAHTSCRDGAARPIPAWARFTLTTVSYALYALAGLNVFAAIARVAMIGKRRKPVTRAEAIISVVYCAAVATILTIAATRLG
jgi:hypothetical protein